MIARRSALLILLGIARHDDAPPPRNRRDAFAATLDALWDFDKPAVSEERFRAELAQVARRRRREAQEVAHADRAHARPAAQVRRRARAARRRRSASSRTLPAHVRVRYLLERGRTFNSSGAPQRAVPLFAEALALAERDKDEFYAVDAAHMLGIAAPAGERLDWNLKALALAEARDRSARPRLARIALQQHRLDLLRRRRRDRRRSTTGRRRSPRARRRATPRTIARREVDGRARLPRASAASTTPRPRRRASPPSRAIGETDGYVYEELAEIALARGDAKAARPWAAKAHAALKDDP